MLLELYAVALKQQIESVVIMFLTVSFLSTAQGLHYCKYSPVTCATGEYLYEEQALLDNQDVLINMSSKCHKGF